MIQYWGMDRIVKSNAMVAKLYSNQITDCNEYRAEPVGLGRDRKIHRHIWYVPVYNRIF